MLGGGFFILVFVQLLLAFLHVLVGLLLLGFLLVHAVLVAEFLVHLLELLQLFFQVFEVLLVFGLFLFQTLLFGFLVLVGGFVIGIFLVVLRGFFGQLFFLLG